ncbi:unnamed protein product [Soboliphyme baturini]|uniref:Peptidase M12B domain-containing protein n=1 Tax=Soboliphyme baturini TaxID=241478 RepID=A0A183IS11_9BILA|nr:unnamed protein product [Soboliphyme baturini]
MSTVLVENFLRMHEWNKELLNRIDDYEIVYPIQIRDRNRVGIDTRNYLFSNITVHFDRCSFIIKSNYGRFKLHVHLNENLMPPGASYKLVLDTDSDFKVVKNVVNCYFQGEIHGYDQSLVSLSTCNGLRGFLSMGNQSFIIIPLKGGDLGRRHPHVFKRVRGTDESLCGNTANTEWDSVLHRKKLYFGKSSVRYAMHETKFIELVVVADLNMMLQDFGTRVSLTRFEAWTTKNLVILHEDIVQSLLDFIRYSSRNLFNDNVDVTLLLTDSDFARLETTMSASGTICTARAAGIVKEGSQFDSYHLAILMAHSLGHILGMKHEDHDSDCQCTSDGGCIMNNFFKLNHVSRRIKFDLNVAGLVGVSNSYCTHSRRNHSSVLEVYISECDTVDPCCDPVTCTLKEESQCSRGSCCDNCKCPDDAHKQDGSPCSNDTGFCYRGRCHLLLNQCRVLWGQDASVAELACFQKFNILGVEYGHCGLDSNGRYLACSIPNSVCGLLYCKEGEESLSAPSYFKTQFVDDRKLFECKYVLI